MLAAASAEQKGHLKANLLADIDLPAVQFVASKPKDFDSFRGQAIVAMWNQLHMAANFIDGWRRDKYDRLSSPVERRKSRTFAIKTISG